MKLPVVTPFVFAHAEALLSELIDHRFAADAVVSTYFRRHRRLGHGDRSFVAEAVYLVLRRLRSLSARCVGGVTPRRLLLVALACAQGIGRRQLDSVLSAADGEWLGQAKAVRVNELPHAVRVDLPDWLYEQLSREMPAAELERLAFALNEQAPLDLRVNTLRTGRDAVLARLCAEGLEATACPWSPLGIRLQTKPALARHPLFLEGSFEVQDEGSQLLAFLLQPRRGEMVADFCAGAGGKTLQLGAMMHSQGRLYAFDVAEHRLARLKARLARSGLSNVSPVRLDSEQDARIRRLAGKLDRVLVDAPCSGLGTVRRNPDLKWRQSEQSVAELSAKQSSILAAAATLLKPGGRLVYATCSLLAAENEVVVDKFLHTHRDFENWSAADILAAQGIELATGERLQLLPHRHATDGFYAAVLERK